MVASSGSRWLPLFALVALSLIWGYTWVIAKQALAYAPPFAFVAQRCAGGALALFAVLLATGRSLRMPAPGWTMSIGLVQGAGFMALQTWALVEGGPGKTAVLIYTMPIWTLLFAWPVLGERVQGRQWLAAAATVAGLILIIEPWEMHTSALSKSLGLGAALAWAIGTLLVKRMRRHHAVDALALTAWQMGIGAVVLSGVALAVPEPPTQWNLHYFGLLAALAVAGTALGWLLWLYILNRLPAWEASLSVLGTPVVALVSSRFVLGEQFSSFELGGVALIGAGLALLSLLGWLSSRRASISA